MSVKLTPEEHGELADALEAALALTRTDPKMGARTLTRGVERIIAARLEAAIAWRGGRS